MYENKPGFDSRYLSKAYNIFLDRNGYVEKRPGVSLEDMSLAALGDVAINGIFEYTKQGTTGNPTVKKIIHTGGYAYSLSGSDVLANKSALNSTAMAVGNYISHAVLADKYYAADGNTILQYYDGTTWQDIDTPPESGIIGTFAPAVIAVHGWSLWAGGHPGNPSYLYKSVPHIGYDFNTNLAAYSVIDGFALVGASQIPVRTDDGTVITEIIGDHYEQLIIGKEDSIHRIIGATKADFVMPPAGIIDGIGMIRGSVVKANNDLFFASTKGIHRLSTVEQYGDNKEFFISHAIQDLYDGFDKTNMLNWCRSAHWPSKSCIAWVFPSKDADTNDTIIFFFYAVPPNGGWAIMTGHNISSMGILTHNGTPSLYMGDHSRRLLRVAPEMGNDYGSAFTMEAEWVINPKDRKIWKGFREAFISFSPTGGGIDVKTKVDNNDWSDTHSIISNEKTASADEIRAEIARFPVDRSGHILTINCQNSAFEEAVEIYSVGGEFVSQGIRGRIVPTASAYISIDILYIKTAVHWGKDEDNTWRMFNNQPDDAASDYPDDVAFERKDFSVWTEKFAIESNTAAVLGSATVDFNDVFTKNVYINDGGCIYLFATGGDETTNGCYRITWFEGVVYWHELITGTWTLIFDTKPVTADPSVPVEISGYTEPLDPTILEADNFYLDKAGAIYLYPSDNEQTTDNCLRITRSVQDLAIKKRSLGGWLETFAFTRK